MRHEPVPWLPAPARSEAEAAVCTVLTRWSATWMSAVPGVRCVAMPRSAAGALRWHGPAVARVGVKDETEVALGYAACAGRAERANPRDRDLLKRIGADMVRNLAEFLENLIGAGLAVSDDDARDACFQVAAQDGAWTFVLSVHPDALVRLRQEAAGRVRQTTFGKMADALTDIPVALGCHLGAAVLTADQVASLAVGDLVVLDRGLDATLPLLVARDHAAPGSARVGSDDGKITMTVANPITSTRKGA